MTPLTLNPQRIPVDFKWTKKMYHLTYKGVVPKEKFFEAVQLATSTPLDGWSIAVEDTSEMVNGVNVVGYVHTHIAAIFHTRLNLTGARKFDVFLDDPDDPTALPIQVHPNVQPKITATQMETAFHYHAGRKYDVKTGRLSYREPVHHEFHLPPDFSWHRSITEDILEAGSLVEACLAAEIRCKSVSDVNLLLSSAPSGASKKFKHVYDPSTFRFTLPVGWRLMWIHGGTGLGKTKFAVAQCANPCFQKPFDSVGCLESMLRSFNPRFHDAIVLDEADLRFMTRQQIIALFDLDEPATIDVRYKSYTLPAGVRKILISNELPTDLLPPDPHGAIARRYQRVHITEPTYFQSQAPGLQHGQQQLATPPTQQVAP